MKGLIKEEGTHKTCEKYHVINGRLQEYRPPFSNWQSFLVKVLQIILFWYTFLHWNVVGSKHLARHPSDRPLDCHF